MNHFKSITLIFCALIVASCGGGGGNSTPDSSDATLSNLVVSAGAVSPAFETGTTSYTLLVPNDVASSSVTSTANQANATVTVNGVAVSSGAASAAIPLTVGDTELTTLVTAEDGSTTQTYTVTVSREATVVSLELLDPTPGFNHRFGIKVVALGNDNIVVSDPNDSSRFANNGAVHLYSPFSSTPIASLFGDAAGDQLGSYGITALGNNNYVITSSSDDVNDIVNAGSVRLVNGTTGIQIGDTLAGDVENDRLGTDVDSDLLGNNGITALTNNNFVIVSTGDDENGIVNAGSVRLMNGSTGEQIGATLAGDVESDLLGRSGITVLANSNYVIASFRDDENDIVDAGSVRLMSGTNGEQIGATLAGDVESDFLGITGITALGNNNYVIASSFDDEKDIVNAGSVRLVSGTKGEQIGDTLAGDKTNDGLGSNGITALANNNYVIASSRDDENDIVDAGSVRLVSGTKGEQIGDTLAGDKTNDGLGSNGITALTNNNYVIASSFDDEKSIVNAGSVRLVSGTTGDQIGDTLAGDVADDKLGSRITVLGNNNYVIASTQDDENNIVNAGSVRLVDGSAGKQIGSALVGDVEDDMLGTGITALDNNNYVIASSRDDEKDIVNAGSVRLVSGTTGKQIGATLAGDLADDHLGNRGITALLNNDYVIASNADDENGIEDAGSVRLVNGSTGVQIGNAISGAVSEDMLFINVVKSASGDYYILGLPQADKNGQVDAGMVQIVAP